MGPTGFSRLMAQELKEAESYTNRASQYPLFTPEEERVCFREARESVSKQVRQAARKKAVLHNLRLVIKTARGYMGQGVSLDDLIQEGTLGLITAVRRFDYRRGFRFSTYAVWWICQAIVRAIQNQANTVRLPVCASESQKRLRRTINALIEELGRVPTDDELASYLGQSRSKTIESLRRLNRQTVSLDEAVNEAVSNRGSRVSTRRGDLTVDLKTLSALSRLEALEELEKIRKRVAKTLGLLELITSSERDRAVFKLYLGLDGLPPMNNETIGEQFGLSRERIRQIYSKIWDQLEILGSRYDGDGFLEELERVADLQKIVGEEEDLVIAPAQFSPDEADRLLTKLAPKHKEPGHSPPSVPQAVSPQIAEIYPDLTAETVIGAVASHYGLAPQALLARDRRAMVVEARQLAMYLIRHDLGKSFVKVAADLKREDHTTVIHGCQVIEQMVEENERVREKLDAIRGTYLSLETDACQEPLYEPQLDSVSRMVLRVVSRAMGISVFDLLGVSRQEFCILARHLGIYLLREDFNWSFSRIAATFGKADTTPVWHACKEIVRQCAKNRWLLDLIEQIRSSYTLDDYQDFRQLEKSQTRLFPKQVFEAREFRRHFDHQLRLPAAGPSADTKQRQRLLDHIRILDKLLAV